MITFTCPINLIDAIYNLFGTQLHHKSSFRLSGYEQIDFKWPFHLNVKICWPRFGLIWPSLARLWLGCDLLLAMIPMLTDNKNIDFKFALTSCWSLYFELDNVLVLVRWEIYKSPLYFVWTRQTIATICMINDKSIILFGPNHAINCMF